jgi:hypothetical protein
MGTETLATIRESVRTLGDYPRTPKYDDTFVNKQIQAGYAELHEVVADSHEGWWDKDGTVTTVANQAFIALPSDCWRVQAVDLVLGSCPSPLVRVGIDARNRYGSSSNQPAAYRLSSRGLELYPTPNAVYTLKVLYTPKVTPLEEDTEVEFMNMWDEYVIQYAIMQCHQRSERSIQECWAKLYDPTNGLKVRIANAAAERNEQEPKYIPLREDFDPYEVY